MFAKRLICSWIGALGLAAGAFCQTYIGIGVDRATSPTSINKKGESQGFTLTAVASCFALSPAWGIVAEVLGLRFLRPTIRT